MAVKRPLKVELVDGKYVIRDFDSTDTIPHSVIPSSAVYNDAAAREALDISDNGNTLTYTDKDGVEQTFDNTVYTDADVASELQKKVATRFDASNTYLVGETVWAEDSDDNVNLFERQTQSGGENPNTGTALWKELLVTHENLADKGYAKRSNVGILETPGHNAIVLDNSFLSTNLADTLQSTGGFFEALDTTATVVITYERLYGTPSTIIGVEFTFDLDGVSRSFTATGESGTVTLEYAGLVVDNTFKQIKYSKDATGVLAMHFGIVYDGKAQLIIHPATQLHLDSNYTQPADFGTKDDVTATQTAVVFETNANPKTVEAYVDIKVPDVTTVIVDSYTDVAAFVPGMQYDLYTQAKSLNIKYVLNTQLPFSAWTLGKTYTASEVGDLVSSDDRIWVVTETGIGVDTTKAAVIDIFINGNAWVGKANGVNENWDIPNLAKLLYSGSTAKNIVFGSSNNTTGTTIITDNDNMYFPEGEGLVNASTRADYIVAAFNNNTFTDDEGTSTENSTTVAFTIDKHFVTDTQVRLRFTQITHAALAFTDLSIRNGDIPYFKKIDDHTALQPFNYDHLLNILEFTMPSNYVGGYWSVGRTVAGGTDTSAVIGTPDEPEWVGNIYSNTNIIGSTDRLIEVKPFFGKATLNAARLAGNIANYGAAIREGHSPETSLGTVLDGHSGMSVNEAPEFDPVNSTGQRLFALYTVLPERLPLYWHHVRQQIVPNDLKIVGDRLHLDSLEGIEGEGVAVSELGGGESSTPDFLAIAVQGAKPVFTAFDITDNSVQYRASAKRIYAGVDYFRVQNRGTNTNKSKGWYSGTTATDIGTALATAQIQY